MIKHNIKNTGKKRGNDSLFDVYMQIHFQFYKIGPTL